MIFSDCSGREPTHLQDSFIAAMLSFWSFLPSNQAGNPQKTRMESVWRKVSISTHIPLFQHRNLMKCKITDCHIFCFFFTHWCLLHLWRISLRLNFCCGFTACRDNITLRLFNKQPKKHVQTWDCPHQKAASDVPPVLWHVCDNCFSFLSVLLWNPLYSRGPKVEMIMGVIAEVAIS